MLDATQFISGYLEAALWSTNADHLDPEGTGHAGALQDHVSGEDLIADAKAEIELDCLRFIVANIDALSEYVEACESDERIGYDPSKGTPSEYAGHDFWLTRNGHGAGFWDRGLGELGDRLTAASKAAGEAYIDISDFNVPQPT